MRRLALLRHATAAPAPPGGDDRARPLTAAGEAEAARIGAWLRAQGLRPDLVLASPAARALRTAQAACRELGFGAAPRVEDGLYGIDAPALLRLLGRLDGGQALQVLLVGHNPALEEVASHLSGDEDLARRGLPPAGAVVLDLPDDWQDLGAKCASAWRVGDAAGPVAGGPPGLGR